MESDRSVRSFMFSPDSRRLAACMEEGRFGVWEFSTNSECVPIFGVEPDSQTTPRLNKQLMELQDGYATPQCLGRPLCFSLDGDLLVTSSDDDELKLGISRRVNTAACLFLFAASRQPSSHPMANMCSLNPTTAVSPCWTS
jgi:WD40 repeat protein